MKKLASPLLLLAAAALAGCADEPRSPLAAGVGAAALDEAPAAAPVRHILAFDSVNAASLRAAVAAAGGAVEWVHEGARVAVVTGLDDASAAALGGVTLAARDAVVSLAPTAEPELAEVTEDAAAGEASVSDAASQANPAAAFFFRRQWHLKAIGADAAWAAGRLGSEAVSVAILDTGIDYTSPDLAGLVDLERSVSFVPGDDDLIAQFFPGRHPVADLHYHGTHVASTVSSKGTVVAGTTSRVRLIGVKVLGAGSSGATSTVLRGVLYAADADADVINMSLGTELDKPGQGEFNAFLNRVFNYAFRQGSVVVVAANNQAHDLTHNGSTRALYCDMPNVICVSATGPTAASSVNGPWTDVDAFAPYSNYGAPVSVAGPGGTSRITVWGACSRTSLILTACRGGSQAIGLFGTSQAAPHVSGLAALLVEEIGRNRPAQVRARIEQSADDLGKPGKDPYYGHGRISFRNALGL
jgi:subtilisin family serine protease